MLPIFGLDPISPNAVSPARPQGVPRILLFLEEEWQGFREEVTNKHLEELNKMHRPCFYFIGVASGLATFVIAWTDLTLTARASFIPIV